MNPGTSLRHVLLQFGFNQRHVLNMLEAGVLRYLPGGHPLRRRVDSRTVEALVEGEHYVTCRACGARQAHIAPKHLRACSGMDMGGYAKIYPDAPVASTWTSSNKAKSPEQRTAQSRTLKARFQTPEGEVTREQIRAASLSMQAGPVGVRIADKLRAINDRPEMRELHRKEMQLRWAGGGLRATILKWNQDHREEVLQHCARARERIDPEHRKTMWKARAAHHTTSKLHIRFKGAMVVSGLTGFETEGRVGPFAVDEMHPTARLAVEIDGCYWHGCVQCGFPGVPRNRRNDLSKNAYLKRCGWTLLRIKEHEVKADPGACVSRITHILQSLSGVQDAQH